LKTCLEKILKKFSGIIQNNPWIFPHSEIVIQGLLPGLGKFLQAELLEKRIILEN